MILFLPPPPPIWAAEVALIPSTRPFSGGGGERCPQVLRGGATGEGPIPPALPGEGRAAGPRGRGGSRCARAGPAAAPRPRYRGLPLPSPAEWRPAPPRRLDGPCQRARHPPPAPPRAGPGASSPPKLRVNLYRDPPPP